MIAFSVDTSTCLSCGACVKDCVGQALTMHDGYPAMLHEENCIGCQHCLAVCPAGAVSILSGRRLRTVCRSRARCLARSP